METKSDPIRDLKILHIALCIGALLIIVVNHLLIRQIELTGFMDSLNVFSRIGLAVAVLNTLFAVYLFNKRTEELGTDINSENIQDFRAAYILKWTLMEAAILINALFYFFMSADPINILVAILLLLVLYLSKPRIV